MNKNLSHLDRRVLGTLQKGLPASATPYRDMAREIGIETEELLGILEDWKRQGVLRRIGAVVNHFKVGLGAGAMVVWRVEPERIGEVGRTLAGFEQVSHVYERETTEHWPYNVYTMVHGTSQEEVQAVVDQMCRACGVSEYRILQTQRELKKTSPTYISPSNG